MMIMYYTIGTYYVHYKYEQYSVQQMQTDYWDYYVVYISTVVEAYRTVPGTLKPRLSAIKFKMVMTMFNVLYIAYMKNTQ